jgi:hypothetical protein
LQVTISCAQKSFEKAAHKNDDEIGPKGWSSLQFSRQFLGQVFAELVQELECVEVVAAAHPRHALDADGQVLRHESGLNRLNAGLLQGVTEFSLESE